MKKERPGAIYWLNMGIFPGIVCFCYQLEYEQIIKKLKDTKRPSWALALSEDKDLVDNSPYLAMKRMVEYKKTGEKSIYFFLVLKKRFRFNDWDHVMLAHEILHMCQFHLPDVLDRDDEIEAEAYLHSHLMTQCLKQIRENHGK